MGQVFICTDDGPLVAQGLDCPNAAEHQPHPTGYVAHASWADTASKVATQKAPCAGCGLWHVWTPRWPNVRIAATWPVPDCMWDGCKAGGVGERLVEAVWVPVCARHAKGVS